jgi:hypothetical protein
MIIVFICNNNQNIFYNIIDIYNQIMDFMKIQAKKKPAIADFKI